MSLVVLAYPDLAPADYERIQEFRRVHDPLTFHLVAPHVTLVFPVYSWAPDAFIAEIERQARGCRPFSFCLRSAVFNKDVSGTVYHCLLAPDEGFGGVVRLHDRLYAGELFPHRRLDIDFIPHVGVGNSADPNEVLLMVDHWNRQEFAIAGRLSVLDVAVYEHDSLRTIRRIPLDG
jgi:hypothetical protein